MKPIEISGPNGVAPRVVANSAATVRSAEPTRPVRLLDGEPGGAGAISATNAGESAPVDAERVAAIREAIKEGRYPILPARVADALIAAGFLLRTE